MVATRKLGVTILIALSLFVPATAVAAPLDGTVMTVLITPASTVDARVEQIVTQSALLYLDRHQIEATVADYDLSDEEPSRRDITRLARIGGSEFVLLGTYNLASADASRITINFALYLVDPAIPVAVVRGETGINLFLDRSISRFLETLLEDAFEYLADSDIESPENPGFAQFDEGSDAGEDLPPIEDADIFANEEISLQVEARPPASPIQTFEFTAGYAPAIAVGRTASYFTFAHGALAAAYLYPGEQAVFGIGIAGAGIFTTATGTAADGDLLIVPLGLAITLKANPLPFGAYVAVDGGAALIQISNEVLGTFSKFSPYVSGEAGVRFSPVDWFGLNAGISFDAVFEGSLILTSFIPFAAVYVGF